MSNFDRAVKALIDVGEYIDHLEASTAYVSALKTAGLLAPDVRIIRTPEELEALDPDSLLVTVGEGARNPRTTLYWLKFAGLNYLPAIVVATGAQVRAAREALEEEND